MKHYISISNFTSHTRLQVVQAENLDTNSSQYKNVVAIGAAQKRSLTACASTYIPSRVSGTMSN
jgi:hypothetical protein